MSKTTSIVIGAHYADFAAKCIATGRYGSVSEVVRAGLRLLEEQEAQQAALRASIASCEGLPLFPARGSTVYPPDVPQHQWEAHATILAQRQARRAVLPVDLRPHDHASAVSAAPPDASQHPVRVRATVLCRAAKGGT